MEKLKILMAGGRRCGKTTVLTSLYKNSARTLSGTKLSMSVDERIALVLEETYELSLSYFEDSSPSEFIRTADDNASPAERVYPFKLLMNDRKLGLTGLEIEFTDVPGEFFVQPQFRKRTEELIRKSHVVMIAVDSPCLMENKTAAGFGETRHLTYNKSEYVTNFIRTLSIDDIADRMILFLPIKCERYYYDNRMVELAQTVEKGSSSLISFLKSPNLTDRCTVGILPMISLGGIEFKAFGKDVSGSPTNDEIFGLARREETRCYCPRFCDQPLLYTIGFFIKTLELKRWGKGPIALIANLFGVGQKALLTEFGKLRNNMIRSREDGFVFIQNPLNL